MLQKIRDNTQGILSKILIGLIVIVMALFGVGSLSDIFTSGPAALSINDVKIDSFEIDQLVQQKSQNYLRSLGENVDLSDFNEDMFRQSAIDELIQRELLKQSASKSGMTISAASIDRRILSTPDFQIDGVYNDERATLLLQSAGFSPGSYRANLVEESQLNQIVSAYSISGFATDAEVNHIVSLINQKRDFRYLSLNLDGQGIDSEISDAEIAEYYANNQNEFLQEEKIKLSYIELNKESLYSEISVSEDQVRQAYDDETAAYIAQTERHAAHILFEAATDEEYASALTEAESVKTRIDAGEDFAVLANEFSDDLGSAEDGGDVGYTNGDSFVPEFEEALQQLAVEEVSAPVRTEFGIHLIKLLDSSQTTVSTFEERRAAIEKDLKTAEVETLFIARSEELGNLAFESFDLVEPANILKLDLQETDWIDRSGGAGIGAYSGVLNSAFSSEVLEEGLNSELITVDSNRTVVIHVIDHKLPEISPLSDVQGEIAINLRLQRMREQAKQLGETIVSSLESGNNVDTLLATQGLNWNNVEDVKRDDLNVNPAITEQIFTMTAPLEGSKSIKGFALPSGEYVVAELLSVAEGSTEDMEEGEADSIRNFISQQAASLDFAGYMKSIESRADISGKAVQTDDF